MKRKRYIKRLVNGFDKKIRESKEDIIYDARDIELEIRKSRRHRGKYKYEKGIKIEKKKYEMPCGINEEGTDVETLHVFNENRGFKMNVYLQEYDERLKGSGVVLGEENGES